MPGRVVDLSVKRLESEIRKHQRLYDAGKAAIPDIEFDKLVNLLRQKAPQSAVLGELGKAQTPNKIAHTYPMLSLEKCYEEKKLRGWLESVHGPWIVQPKYDGLAISLVYKKGKLICATTRGDGRLGDDVTPNALHVTHLPTAVPYTEEDIVVRGEVIMPVEHFKQYASLAYANPRNIVAGIMLRKQQVIEDLRSINFLAYDVLGVERDTTNLEDRMERLSDWGFLVAETEYFKSHETEALIGKLTSSAKNDHTVYEVDGLVVKACRADVHVHVGSTAHHPRWAVAWKFQGDTGHSKLTGVEWNVSRAGVVTPVALMRPVTLSGVSITRATLHNVARMEELQLKHNSLLTVTRRGGVIPHVESATGGHALLEACKHCPSCNKPLRRDGVQLLCSNRHLCPGVKIQQILHWCKETGMLGWGQAYIEQAYAGGVIKHIPDLYRATARSLAEEATFGLRIAKKLIAEIDKTRTLSPKVFLTALGIEGLGSTVAEKLLKQQSIDQILDGGLDTSKNFDRMRLSRVTAISQSLLDLDVLIGVLLEHITFESPQVAGAGVFAGQSVVFTGSLSDMDRGTAQALVREHGGYTPPHLTKDTNLLVVGDLAKDNQTSKRDKAAKYGVKVITETEFASMLALTIDQ